MTWANIDKAKKYLNWLPNINLKIGVSELLLHINYWKNATLWDKERIQKATKNWFKYLK